MKNFINGEASTKLNAATIGMLYTYWHEIANDGITSPTIDEHKEIEELLSLLPSDLVLTQISVQSLVSGEFAYTYVFKRPYTLNAPTKELAETISKVIHFLSKTNDINKNAGHFYVTPLNGTNIVIGTFIISNALPTRYYHP